MTLERLQACRIVLVRRPGLREFVAVVPIAIVAVVGGIKVRGDILGIPAQVVLQKEFRNGVLAPDPFPAVDTQSSQFCHQLRAVVLPHDDGVIPPGVDRRFGDEAQLSFLIAVISPALLVAAIEHKMPAEFILHRLRTTQVEVKPDVRLIVQLHRQRTPVHHSSVGIRPFNRKFAASGDERGSSKDGVNWPVPFERRRRKNQIRPRRDSRKGSKNAENSAHRGAIISGSSPVK